MSLELLSLTSSSFATPPHPPYHDGGNSSLLELEEDEDDEDDGASPFSADSSNRKIVALNHGNLAAIATTGGGGAAGGTGASTTELHRYLQTEAEWQPPLKLHDSKSQFLAVGPECLQCQTFPVAVRSGASRTPLLQIIRATSRGRVSLDSTHLSKPVELPPSFPGGEEPIVHLFHGWTCEMFALDVTSFGAEVLLFEGSSSSNSNNSRGYPGWSVLGQVLSPTLSS
jgi:hypothetical protein